MNRWIALALAGLALGLWGCQKPVETPDFFVTNSMLREKGYDAINAGDLPAARGFFQQAVDRKPDDALSWYYLGRMQLRLDEPLDAELSLEKALALRPNDPELTPMVLDYLAEAMFKQRRYDNLAAFLAETADSSNASADYLRQARYLVRIGDPDGAAAAYRKAAYFAPRGDAAPYLELADYYLSINDIPNGTIALRYAYYEDPDTLGLAERFRRLGIVPGPTVGLEPPKPRLAVE